MTCTELWRDWIIRIMIKMIKTKKDILKDFNHELINPLWNRSSGVHKTDVDLLLYSGEDPLHWLKKWLGCYCIQITVIALMTVDSWNCECWSEVIVMSTKYKFEKIYTWFVCALFCCGDVISFKGFTRHWLGGKLWYLQQNHVGDTIARLPLR